jgi:hypothetical protein
LAACCRRAKVVERRRGNYQLGIDLDRRHFGHLVHVLTKHGLFKNYKVSYL